ncbi:GATA transcription factor 11-like [Andrographis paniculata]|uniref:GATA transcription factor 11-like n=1 Tax=Andrographis paniculata TaxID=175694 RepID=UPI0021E93AA2|nr:GATA transcription factor 11-like [Andrographis paniculata]
MELPQNWDGIMSGATEDDELDNILNGILDFPMESLEAEGLAGDWDSSKSHYLGPIPSDDVLMGSSVIAHAKTDLQHPVPFPFPFPSQMDPEPKPALYQFSDSSGSCVPQPNKYNMVSEQVLFQSPSPVSVLESSASSSAGKACLPQSRINKRVRSRRSRPSGANPWVSVLPLLTSRKTQNARRTKGAKKKQSRLQISVESAAVVAMDPTTDGVEPQNSGAIKKCTHCQVTKTPQWREGPMGPKTLCNACGVRYRSGRLFPEYRPAASPTFVAAVHSNSHKKVLEMRNKGQVHQVMEIMNGN